LEKGLIGGLAILLFVEYKAAQRPPTPAKIA
jgi:hypothetical protein